MKIWRAKFNALTDQLVDEYPSWPKWRRRIEAADRWPLLAAAAGATGYRAFGYACNHLHDEWGCEMPTAVNCVSVVQPGILVELLP